MRHRAFILALIALPLSACSTLMPVYHDVMGVMSWDKTEEGEVTMISDYISSDLLAHANGRIEKLSEVSIITSESDEWGSLENGLRKEGFAVRLIKRLRNAKTNPIIYTITDVADKNKTHGVLRLRGKFQLSRTYDVGEDFVINGSPMSVLEEYSDVK